MLSHRQLAKNVQIFPRHKIVSHTKDLHRIVEQLVWAEDGTPNGRIEYVLAGGVLVVTGDFGAAVYQWGGQGMLDLETVAKFELDYFAEKCTASTIGLPFQEWSKTKAGQYIQAHFAQVLEVGGKRAHGKVMKAFADNGGLAAIEDREVWDRWLDQYGALAFPGDWMDLGDIGERVHPWCRAHMAGLMSAFGDKLGAARLLKD